MNCGLTDKTPSHRKRISPENPSKIIMVDRNNDDDYDDDATVIIQRQRRAVKERKPSIQANDWVKMKIKDQR